MHSESFIYQSETEVLEAAAGFIKERFKRSETFTSALDAQNFLNLRLGYQEREVFAVLFLDSQHRLIQYQELFFGTIDAAAVYPREVVKAALHHNAAAVIFSHNHPSGVSQPSQADISITDKLKKALDLIDVRTLDHIIIGEDTFSFAESGYL
jgi:DNA repair protein RadC|tara:strand:- start:2046 stop:2504 length:459 start_codon:yes stop_codon:yes gene_type:complete